MFDAQRTGKATRMDSSSFDHLVRRFGGALSRRDGAKALLAAAVGAVVIIQGDAQPDQDAAARANKPRPTGRCGDGSGKANSCKKNSQCCTGWCASGRCRCKPNAMACANNDECCAGLCTAGACDGGAKGEGARCEMTDNCGDGLSCEKKKCVRDTSPSPTPVPPPSWAPTVTFGTYGTGTGQFQSVWNSSLTTDELELYVADVQSQHIAVWTRSSTTGYDWSNTSTVGSSSDLTFPADVIVSADNLTLWILDKGLPGVSVWKRPNVSSAWAFDSTIGNGTGDGNDQFQQPYAFAMSSNELEMYFSDWYSARIEVWTRTSTSAPWTASAPLGSYGTGTDQFAGPGGLTLSADNLELYVADTDGYRVCQWKRTTVGGAWSAVTTFGSQGSGPGQFNAPQDVQISSDGLYLYVSESINCRFSMWSRASATDTWTPVTTYGSSGSGPNQFGRPAGITLRDTELYIADASNRRVSNWSTS